MDPVRNPFAPGAGTPPPELAGRDGVLEAARIALERSRLGRPSKNMVLIGLRGVGKTVLLDAIREQAETMGMYTLDMEAAESRSLPSVLAPPIACGPFATFPQGDRKAIGAPSVEGPRRVCQGPEGDIPGP